jgi:hypothetical protein
MTIDEILEFQDHAVRTGDKQLLSLAWTALGYDRNIAFVPVTIWEQRDAIEKLVALR